MTVTVLQNLQGAITQRQTELNRVALVLADKAQYLSRCWVASRISLITLGALGATKGTFDAIWSSESTINLVLFTAIGLLVAIITGLETTFKYEAKNNELKLLAAECHAMIRQIDTLWFQKVSYGEIESRLCEAKNLIQIQDNKLTEIQSRATKIGLNITLEIRELFSEAQETPYLA